MTSLRQRPAQQNGAGRVAHLLVEDSELGARLAPEALEEAKRRLIVRVAAVPAGPWPGAEAPGDAGHLGYLVLDGLLGRTLRLAGSSSTELLGPGDIVRPWESEDEDGLMQAEVAWHVLSPTRLAILDSRVAATAARWPEVTAALLERSSRRAQRLAIQQAICQLTRVDARLLALFWHLAERWGRVSRDGVLVPLRLPHRTLGQLVGARRPSVTTALRQLAEQGVVVRRADGAWLLAGEPPGAEAPDNELPVMPPAASPIEPTTGPVARAEASLASVPILNAAPAELDDERRLRVVGR